MNKFEAAQKSAEEIFEDVLNRAGLREAFKQTGLEIRPSIKCMILEEWVKIIMENFDK